MRGFTVVELLVAMAITLIVAAATVSLVGPAHHAFQVQPERADLQQRVRVGIDALLRDLVMAGAGMYVAGDVGPLHRALAPVMPYRAFGGAPDPENGTYFRPDAISVVFVPSTASQTVLTAPMAAGSLEMNIEHGPPCPAASAGQICGFAAGDRLLVFDRASEWAVFTVDRLVGTGLVLRGLPPDREFGEGSSVAEAVAVVYALRADAGSGAFQLVRSTGFEPALPVLDHVVKLQFQYFGEPRPPRVLDDDEVPPRVSYGPAPPDPGEAVGGWPSGENCLFAFVDGRYQTRLVSLGSPGPLVEITPALMMDGPWCPDAVARNRFDGDLLRVRRVRLTLRVQAALSALRGPAGALFANPGLARDGRRFVPDLEVQLDVTPRNLNLGTPN